MFSDINYYVVRDDDDGSIKRTVAIMEGLNLEALQKGKAVVFMEATEFFYGGTVEIKTAFSVELKPNGEYLIGYEKTSKNYEDPNEIHWDSDFAETISKAQYLIDSAKRDWLEGTRFLGTEEFPAVPCEQRDFVSEVLLPAWERSLPTGLKELSSDSLREDGDEFRRLTGKLVEFYELTESVEGAVEDTQGYYIARLHSVGERSSL